MIFVLHYLTDFILLLFLLSAIQFEYQYTDVIELRFLYSNGYLARQQINIVGENTIRSVFDA